MGVADLVAAFNLVAEPRFTCVKAFLTYEPGDGIQWQRLTFRGTDAGGLPFEVRTDRLRPETDLAAAARSVAADMLAKPLPAAPATEPGEPSP